MPVQSAMNPTDANATITAALARQGGTVTVSNPQQIVGTVTTHKRPSIILGLLLCLLFIVPGIIYFVVAGRDKVEPFTVTLTPDGTGTVVNWSGTGKALKTVERACRSVA